MSTVERKEYQETKIMRTRSPIRGGYRSTSTQNLAEFDHNLDHLLEDLQNSVSRPGSSLGGTLTSKNSTDVGRFTNVRAANPVQEFSSDDAYSYTSPDGNKKVTGYKKESYSYKTTSGGGEGRMQNNINQLDSLLDDLQQVKNSRDKEVFNSVTGSDPEFQRSSRRNVQRELHYGDTPRSNSRSRSEREIQYSTNEGTYGDLRQIRGRSPSPSSRTSTLSKQTKVSNVHTYPMEVIETSTPDINPEILAHLDPNLHPPGNTKVTTTIKTYTYEIPGSGGYPTKLEEVIPTGGNSNYSSRLEEERHVYSPQNQSQSTPSRSFVYSKTTDSDFEERRTYRKPDPPGGSTQTVTTRSYQPGYLPENERHHTYVYNETTSTRKVPSGDRDVVPPPPPVQNTYIKESHSSVNNQQNGYLPPQNNKTVIYRHETHTTTNNGYGPPQAQPYPRGPPDEPLNIQYKYKSESSTTNKYKGGYPRNDDAEVLLPRPFPNNTSQPDGPPKSVDELMANIGREPANSPYNAGYTAHEHELEQKKKIETLKRQQEEVDDLQKKEPVQKSKNVSGPPVYYPPGHEMFAKKEEEAGWRAEGAYQKSSGKYQYEADSKSKSKSRSGAAVVPVCLPLCCGLPCALI